MGLETNGQKTITKKILKNLESKQKRRDGSSALLSRMRGLFEGNESHVLVVARIWASVWVLVTKMRFAGAG